MPDLNEILTRLQERLSLATNPLLQSRVNLQLQQQGTMLPTQF